jgi:hypothetical protein
MTEVKGIGRTRQLLCLLFKEPTKGPFINYVRVPREWGGVGKIFTYSYFILEITRSSCLAGIIFHLSTNIMIICI